MTRNERHRAEVAARAKFQRKLEQLRFELRLDKPHTPRRVLDYLLEHCEDILPQLGDNLLRAAFRQQLDELRVLVLRRHDLRLLQGGAA